MSVNGRSFSRPPAMRDYDAASAANKIRVIREIRGARRLAGTLAPPTGIFAGLSVLRAFAFKKSAGAFSIKAQPQSSDCAGRDLKVAATVKIKSP